MSIVTTQDAASPESAGRICRLSHVPTGSSVIVHQLDANDIGMPRLMAMGVCVGRRIEVVRQGNPLIVRLLGARVGISGRLAEHVLVERSEA